jgi:hypothetical protein
MENKLTITEDQQAKLLSDYIKDKHNQDECSGFIDGMDAVINLIINLQIEELKRLI